MKPEQWVIVRAQISRIHRSIDDAIEHTADNGTIEHFGVDSETDDTPGILIHDNHHPMGL